MNFISYEPTPNEEKQLGVATVTYNGPIVLRYKLVPNKTGGNFLTSGSCKVGEQWINSFEIDSKSQSLLMEKLIRDNMGKQSVAPIAAPRTPEMSWTPPTSIEQSYSPPDGLPF